MRFLFRRFVQPASALAVCGLLACAPAAAERLTGEVVRVWDGDSLHLTDRSGLRHKIRLADIDAPEIGQASGTVCRDRLRGQLLHREVEAEVLDTDRYGRKVARIWLDGQDVGLAQIGAGCAWHYRSAARRRGADGPAYAVYAEAEAAARLGRTGLWRQADPQPPWRFRHRPQQAD